MRIIYLYIIMILCFQSLFSQINFYDKENYWTGSMKCHSNLIDDFNNDGINDLIIASGFLFDEEDDYKLFIFSPDENYDYYESKRVSYPQVYPGIASLAKGDLNNDGLQDIVLAYSDSIAVFFQDPDEGITEEYQTFFSGVKTIGLDCGDVNSDGLDDIIVSHIEQTHIRVFYQNPFGFADTTYYKPVSSFNVVITEDINCDGHNDVVVTNGKVMQGGVDEFSFCIYLQDTITHKLMYPILYNIDHEEADYNKMDGLAIGDLNNDGLPDIAGCQIFNTYVWFQESDNPFFFNPTPIKINDIDFNSGPVEIADFNLDGKNEIVKYVSGYNKVLVFESDENYNFSNYLTFDIYGVSNMYQTGLSIGDLNNDGLPDISSTWSWGASNLINNSTVGVISFDTLTDEGVIVYPNPTDGQITVETDRQAVSIIITNINGREIFNNQYSINNNQFLIDLSNYPDGLYFAKIIYDNKSITKKIILQK